MNNTFVKTALATGVVAALSYAEPSMAAALAPVASDVVVLGCTVPSSGTTVSTVYSVDAVSSQNSTYTISLPTAAAVGKSCAGAIKALGTTSSAAVTIGGVTYSAGTFQFSTANANGAPVVQAIPGTGYTALLYTFNGNGSYVANTAAAYGGSIGCAAAGASGATVYSVDSTNVANTSSVTTLNALVGAPCSYALATASGSLSTGFGTGSTSQAPSTNAVVNINTNGYSLNQYSFQ